MARPCLSKLTQHVQESARESLTKLLCILCLVGSLKHFPSSQALLLWSVLRQGLNLAQAGLEPGDLLASASQVPGLKLCTTMPRKPALVSLVRTWSYKEFPRRPSQPLCKLSLEFDAKNRVGPEDHSRIQLNLTFPVGQRGPDSRLDPHGNHLFPLLLIDSGP